MGKNLPRPSLSQPLDTTKGDDASKLVQASCTDLNDGSYRLEWQGQVAGQYVASVTIANVHLVGSPFELTLQAGPPDISKIQVSGDGLASAQAGHAALLRLFCVDSFDNLASRDAAITFGLRLLPRESKVGPHPPLTSSPHPSTPPTAHLLCQHQAPAPSTSMPLTSHAGAPARFCMHASLVHACIKPQPPRPQCPSRRRSAREATLAACIQPKAHARLDAHACATLQADIDDMCTCMTRHVHVPHCRSTSMTRA